MQTLRVNGYDMAYLEVGESAGQRPPLVCVHGSLCDFRIWSSVLGPLTQKHRVIAVSLRHFFPDHWDGIGDTYSIAQHVDDVIAFIEQLDGQPVDLMGHSRGGHISFRVAQRRPDLLRKLILAEPGGELDATLDPAFKPGPSPLAARIEAIRAKILAEARAHGWPISEAQLDDRHIVRRMVLKRVVYGIDKNPMAVELAKVALWLHSFTVGAPLSFLDHHLRCGDSVLGAWARPTLDALRARGALFNAGVITRVEQVAGLMAEIEETTDNDIAEVAQSKAKFGAVEDVTDPVAAFFSLLTAEKLMGIFERAPKKAPLAVERWSANPRRR